MQNCCKGDIILLPFPFTDFSTLKVRPAVIVGKTLKKEPDLFIVPLTSKIHDLLPGEFPISDWKNSGLNVPTAVKKGCLLIDKAMIKKVVGKISSKTLNELEKSLKFWLDL